MRNRKCESVEIEGIQTEKDSDRDDWKGFFNRLSLFRTSGICNAFRDSKTPKPLGFSEINQFGKLLGAIG